MDFVGSWDFGYSDCISGGSSSGNMLVDEQEWHFLGTFCTIILEWMLNSKILLS